MVIGIVAAFKAGIPALKQVIELIKSAKDLLPNGEKKSSVEQKIMDAEKAFRLAEVQTAQALGYQLHQCTFPPQIMLSVGHAKEKGMEGVELFKCLNCQELTPTEAEIRAWKDTNARAKNRAKGYSVQ